MIRLAKALAAWGTPQFTDVLKREIAQLDASQLPLQAGLSSTSHALDSGIDVMILTVSEGEGMIRVKTGIFYRGVIAGCSCADDPTPMDEQSEYCEVQFVIDQSTAETRVTLLPQ